MPRESGRRREYAVRTTDLPIGGTLRVGPHEFAIQVTALTTHGLAASIAGVPGERLRLALAAGVWVETELAIDQQPVLSGRIFWSDASSEKGGVRVLVDFEGLDSTAAQLLGQSVR